MYKIDGQFDEVVCSPTITASMRQILGKKNGLLVVMKLKLCYIRTKPDKSYYRIKKDEKGKQKCSSLALKAGIVISNT